MTGAGRRAIRIFDGILTLGGVLAGVLLVAVMFTVSIKVFFRYVLHEGLIGIDQISGILLLWITFLGAAWALRREEHITIDLLVSHLPPGIRRWLGIVTSILCALVCLVLVVYGSVEVFTSWQKGIRIPEEIELPRWTSLIVIPAGCLLLTVQFLRRSLRFYRREHVGRAVDAPVA